MTKTQKQSKPAIYTGSWRISEMPNFDEGYLEDGDEPAQMTLKVDKNGSVSGHCNAATMNAHIEGRLCTFGSETVLIVCAEGTDDGDAFNVAGWMRLSGSNTLVGEFLNDFGEFTAERK